MRPLIFIIFLFTGCVAPAPVQHYIPAPIYHLDPAPSGILLINTYNVGKKFRENKEELFVKFIDSIIVTAASEIRLRTGVETKAVKGLSNISSADSLYFLMKQTGASHAIVIDSFDVYFEQTNVEVTKTESGKNREAYYDIISLIKFSFYNNNSLFKESLMTLRRNHSSRSVISGLLAAGPNIVVQRKDGWKITYDNLIDYLDLFFERKKS